MRKSMPKNDAQYSEQEAQERFQRLLRSALTTPPKPLKSMSPKGVRAQRKKSRAKRPARKG
jgi:hypothetical protein